MDTEADLARVGAHDGRVDPARQFDEQAGRLALEERGGAPDGLGEVQAAAGGEDRLGVPDLGADGDDVAQVVLLDGCWPVQPPGSSGSSHVASIRGHRWEDPAGRVAHVEVAQVRDRSGGEKSGRRFHLRKPKTHRVATIMRRFMRAPGCDKLP